MRGDLGQSGGRSTPGKDEGIKGVPQPSSPPLGRSVCPATHESVMEIEESGDTGCPICGLSAGAHYSVRWWRQQKHDHNWKLMGLDSWRCVCGATKTAIV